MKKLELTPDAIALHKEKQGFTDEQLQNLTPTQINIMNSEIASLVSVQNVDTEIYLGELAIRRR